MWYYFKVLSGYDFNPCDAEPGYTLSFSNSVAPDQLVSNAYTQHIPLLHRRPKRLL